MPTEAQKFTPKVKVLKIYHKCCVESEYKKVYRQSTIL